MRRPTTPLRAAALRHRDFYRPAAGGVAAGPPGTLVRAEPMIARLLPGIALRAHAWRVLYTSTTALGAPVDVSGTVLVPRRPYPGQRPLIGYAIGTQGHGAHCAPSLQLLTGLEYETALIMALLRRGWAVALTDYPGLGASGRHPYIVGRALGPAVLDSMRAARQLEAAALPPEGPAALFGYSEGGTAAGWAAQLQPTYAPDIPLAAAALGGVAADLEFQGEFLDGGRFAWLLAYTALGMDVAYPELDLDGYLTPAGRKMAARLADTHIVTQILTGLPFRFDRHRYLTEDLMAHPDWLARFRENRLGGIAPAAPVLLTHGQRDQVLGYAQAPVLRDDWTRLGVDVTFRGFRGLEHLTAGPAHTRVAVPWLAGQLGEGRRRRRAA
ncbi:lipase family protein [Nocardia sp. NPDC057668]|uniref:lipase family protein n=1 Tax=Nocardia sp. NPDC057668 TaxID=3346202 RepID=UPI003671A939